MGTGENNERTVGIWIQSEIARWLNSKRILCMRSCSVLWASSD